MNRSTRRAPRKHWDSLFATSMLGVALLLPACSSPPPLVVTGFLSDYTTLESVSDSRMRYISADLADYNTFIIDPVQIRPSESKLSEEERVKVAAYFREALERELNERGYTVTDTPALGTARIRVALTDVKNATWWKKIHPASNLAGAGRGGAAMEGEMIDAVTGQQLAAVVQAGVGSQFTLFNFSTVSDVKSTIDQWAETACERLNELRSNPAATR